MSTDPSYTPIELPSTTYINDPVPDSSLDGKSSPSSAPPPAFIANGGYIYMILLMTLVIGTIYFCRVIAAKRKERLRLLKEQDMANQFPYRGNNMNPPLYDDHDRDIPVVVVVVDDEYDGPAPSYTEEDPSNAANTHDGREPEAPTTVQGSPSRRGTRSRRRSSQPIELQPVGARTTTTHLVSPAAVMVRGEPYAHILTPRTPSPAPHSTSSSASPSSSPSESSMQGASPMQQGHPPAYEDIAATGHSHSHQSMMISETRIGIGHQYPLGPGRRPLSKP
ncbi:hypothetical protein BGW42_000738 [Actinomortierella wolfii]|nr:hypothetical protein BGW42_000738 [Actinomortierella wolfii]